MKFTLHRISPKPARMRPQSFLRTGSEAKRARWVAAIRTQYDTVGVTDATPRLTRCRIGDAFFDWVLQTRRATK